jgi:hypothetical protein
MRPPTFNISALFQFVFYVRYNSYISSMSQDSEKKNFRLAEDVYVEIKQLGRVEPDLFTYNAM